MRLLILGCGLMAPAAAYNAGLDPNVSRITLTDMENEPLEAAKAYFGGTGLSGKIATALLDVTDREEALELMEEADVIISALPRKASPAAIRAANAAGRPLVDLITPPEEEMAELKDETAAAGNLVIPGCGLDPGLTEIMAHALAERFDRVEAVHIRCGGIPEKPQPPLGYKIVFGSRKMPLREEDAAVAESGRIKRVPRYSGLETFQFPGIGELEAYHEGFMPWLLELEPLKNLPLGTQKTVRWPGYTDKVNILKEIGLLSLKPVDVDGVPVVPKRFLDALLAPWVELKEGERDLVVFRVEVGGERDGRRAVYRMETLVRYDEKKNLTAMAQVTSYTASIVARMVGRGEFKLTGLLTPEKIVTGAHLDRLVTELAREGISFHFSEKS